MKSYSAAILAALAGGHAAIVQLVLFEFPSGDIALNTSNYNLTWDGRTYMAAYGLGSVSPIKDSPGEIQGVTFEMDAGSSDMVSLAFDGTDQVQDTPATIMTAIVDTADLTQLSVLTAAVDWTGLCDVMRYEEDGQAATISMTAESKAVDLLRGNPSYYSDGDQQAAFPGDRAFEYTVSQAGQRIVWPSREYFFQ